MLTNTQIKAIQMVVLDVDGVLTDGTINTAADGELFKTFSVRDGLGIQMLRRAGIEVAIITGRTSDILSTRMKELGVTRLYQGQRFKTTAYEDLLRQTGLSDKQVAYMGDDVPDLPLLMRVGLPTTPADGNPDLNPYIAWRSSVDGGRGAVRELAELILKTRGVWDRLVHETFVLGK